MAVDRTVPCVRCSLKVLSLKVHAKGSFLRLLQHEGIKELRTTHSSLDPLI